MKVLISDISCTSVFMPGDYIIGMVMKVINKSGGGESYSSSSSLTTIYIRDNSGGTIPVATSFIKQEQHDKQQQQQQQASYTLEKGVTIRCEDLQARTRGSSSRDSGVVYRTEVHSGRVTILSRRLFTTQQMLRNVDTQSDYDYLAQSAASNTTDGNRGTIHNILGVVTRVFPRSDDVVTKLGRITTKQSILITGSNTATTESSNNNNNNNNILVTFWGSQVTEIASAELVEGQTVLLLENAAVTLYNGRLQATAAADSILTVDPPVPAAAALLEATQGTVRVHIRPDDIVDTYTVAMIARTLESVGRSDSNNSTSERPSIYGRLIAAISYVGLGSRVPTFLACPVCRRRVADTHCEHCGKAVFPVATLALRIKAMDSTGEIALTLFGATAEQFLGVSADDLAAGAAAVGKEAASLEARWAIQARILWIRHSVAFKISPTGTISVLQCTPYK